MDAVTGETKADVPRGMLYVDDLVLMAAFNEELRMKLEDHRWCIVRKGMTVNAEKSKVMVSNYASGVAPEYDAWSYEVCASNIAANSPKSTTGGK